MGVSKQIGVANFDRYLGVEHSKYWPDTAFSHFASKSWENMWIIWKQQILTMFGVHSTQTLVKIYNKWAHARKAWIKVLMRPSFSENNITSFSGNNLTSFSENNLTSFVNGLLPGEGKIRFVFQIKIPTLPLNRFDRRIWKTEKNISFLSRISINANPVNLGGFVC